MFWSIYSNLCSSNGTSPSAVAVAIGLSNSIATKWKKGAYPSGDILLKLAEYFNVSVDYLLTGKEPTKSGISKDEQEFLNAYNQLSEKGKIKLTGYMQCLIDEEAKTGGDIDSEIKSILSANSDFIQASAVENTDIK